MEAAADAVAQLYLPGDVPQLAFRLGGLTRGCPPNAVLSLYHCCGDPLPTEYSPARRSLSLMTPMTDPPSYQVARARAEQHPPVVRVHIQPVDNDGAAADPSVRLHLSYQSVSDLVRFAHASVHYMPLPSCSYDVVYGQDPDGLANPDRLHAFRYVRQWYCVRHAHMSCCAMGA